MALVIVFLAITFVWISGSSHSAQGKFLLNATVVALAATLYFLGFWIPTTDITFCFWILLHALYVILLILSVTWIGVIAFGSTTSSLANPVSPLIGALVLVMAVLVQPYIQDPLSRTVLLILAVLSLGLLTIATTSIYSNSEIEPPPEDDTILSSFTSSSLLMS